MYGDYVLLQPGLGSGVGHGSGLGLGSGLGSSAFVMFLSILRELPCLVVGENGAKISPMTKDATPKNR